MISCVHLWKSGLSEFLKSLKRRGLDFFKKNFFFVVFLFFLKVFHPRNIFRFFLLLLFLLALKKKKKQERLTDEPADRTGDKILIQPSSSAPHPGANKGIGDCHADGQKSALCPLFGAVLHTK